MDGSVNNNFVNEALPLNKDIKLETEQDNVTEMICLFLPDNVTEIDTSFEHQEDLLQLKEEPLDIVDGDVEKDPLAIEETKLVKSENFKIENEEVTIDEGTIEDSTKNFITCKRCINNSVHDGIIKEKSNECMCVYGDVTTEKDLVENISSKNKLPVQKGKKLVCEYCSESFKCKCYLKSHINFQAKEKKNNTNFCQKSFNQSSTLKSHLNIHTKEKNYMCNFCQKVFNSSSSLKKHLNIHTKEKNYVCNFCPKSFNH
ncbi:uncharacterized protein LOC142330000 [Lycorma delicatula]|uniref:uncharacterized protein LOC142330000 n=1 Tax=Lycorma delicatula TaxID=130591 RepID=UPI003F5199D5